MLRPIRPSSMELRHLRYFQAVADTLSFSRAAARLRIAQSAVSRQVAALEQELGAKLFVRTTSSVRLTEAGRHFHAEVERILAQLAIAATATQEIGRGRGGELLLGNDWRILQPQIAETVVQFRAANPRLAVNFVDLTVHHQLEALRDGRIHLAFVSKNILHGHADIAVQPLYSAEMKAALPRDHRLAGRERIELAELRDETWLRLEEKSHPGYRALVIQLCHPALFTPRFGPVANSIEGMLTRVTLGDGICLMPECLIARPNPSVRYVPTDCPPFEFTAAWLKNTPNTARGNFLKLLRKNLAAAPPPVAAG